jgi:hypothetical protein
VDERSHKKAGGKYSSNEMSFRQTITGVSRTDRGFIVVVDRTAKKVLISFAASDVDKRHKDWLASVKKRTGLAELDPQPYWGFDDLSSRARSKLHNCFYLQADVKWEKDSEYFHYKNIMQLSDFDFDKFLSAIEAGAVLVDFDARTGHNHGTKFRLRQDWLPELYSKLVKIY